MQITTPIVLSNPVSSYTNLELFNKLVGSKVTLSEYKTELEMKAIWTEYLTTNQLNAGTTLVVATVNEIVVDLDHERIYAKLDLDIEISEFHALFEKYKSITLQPVIQTISFRGNVLIGDVIALEFLVSQNEGELNINLPVSIRHPDNIWDVAEQVDNLFYCDPVIVIYSMETGEREVVDEIKGDVDSIDYMGDYVNVTISDPEHLYLLSKDFDKFELVDIADVVFIGIERK